jgi:hypothetical protein
VFENAYTEEKPTSVAVHLSMKYERLKQKNVTSTRLVILYCHLNGKVKKTLKFILEHALKAQRASRSLDLQVRPLYSRERDPIPILQVAG